MITLIVAGFAGLAAGIWIGHSINAGTLKKIEDTVHQLEISASTEARQIAATLRLHL